MSSLLTDWNNASAESASPYIYLPSPISVLPFEYSSHTSSIFTHVYVLTPHTYKSTSLPKQIMADQVQATYKRIILCCDGTWLAANTGDSSSPSNVAKLARAIAPTGVDADGKLVKQVVLYHSGLGSTSLPGAKAIEGMSPELCSIALHPVGC